MLPNETFARYLLALLMAHVLMAGNLLGAIAQSGQDVRLRSNRLTGIVEATGKSDYYSFVAGPGDVNVSVEASADFYSSSVEVALSDMHERQLIDVPITADNSGANKVATLHLDHKQRVRMSVLFGTNPGVHLKYDVKLSGAISFDDGVPELANTGVQIADAVGSKTTTSIPVGLSSPAATVPVDGGAKAVNGPIEDKWAIIVGVSKYADPKIIDLNYSAKDASDLGAYLVKEANFAPDHVKVLVDAQATKEHVLEEIGDKWLPRMARPNDLVLIFISCHGSPSQLDGEGWNYLIMHDTRLDSLYATGLPVRDLASVIRHRVHAERVVVIVDACHSGSAETSSDSKGILRTGNIDSAALSQGSGQLVICSSKPNEVSWESKRYQNGVFTHQLIEALRKNSGRAKLGSVFGQLKESVIAEVLNDRKELQTPILKSMWSGDDLILSAPPTRARSGALEQP